MRGANDAGSSTQGLAATNMNASAAAGARMRNKLRSREITERKQVGDAESMMNEEPASMREAVDESKS
jgi:hypothetical protein